MAVSSELRAGVLAGERSRTARPRRRPQRRDALLWLLAAVVAVIMVFPLYWMFATAVSPLPDLRAADYAIVPSSLDLGVFGDLWDRFPLNRWYVNSLVIAIVGVALAVTMNLVAGYAFAKLRFPGSTVIFLLIVSTLFVPIQVLMVPQFQVVTDLGWFNSNVGVIVPRAAEAFGIYFARQYFLSIPNEVIEAARLDGASELTILRRVVLPLCKPLVAVLVIFTFMWRWNEFAWPLIVLRDIDAYTAPIGLFFLQGQYASEYTSIMAMALITALPTVIVFLIFQRYFVEGVVRSGLK